MRVNENRTELFSFLTDQIINSMHSAEKIVLVTKETHALSNKPVDVEEIHDWQQGGWYKIDPPLNYMLASQDTRTFMICTLGTDVVVLAVAKINELGSGETWKQGKTFATSQYMQLWLNFLWMSALCFPFLYPNRLWYSVSIQWQRADKLL